MKYIHLERERTASWGWADRLNLLRVLPEYLFLLDHEFNAEVVVVVVVVVVVSIVVVVSVVVVVVLFNLFLFSFFLFLLQVLLLLRISIQSVWICLSCTNTF